MAFSTTVEKVSLLNATPGLVVVTGTFTNTGGSTGGVINPASPTTNNSTETLTGFTTIWGWVINNAVTQAATQNKEVKSNSGGQDIVTLTCVADEDGTWTMICYAGA